jgi:nitroimidazol reductase NimA-like FMN-containing flavoprotein (pyridoxamine 5'-phosphate oxidase superfamily)
LEFVGFGSYVGRLAFHRDGRLLVVPVNYLYQSPSVYVQTSGDGILADLDGQDVAFEVDHFDALERSGWSVVINGAVQIVQDAEESERLRRGPLKSWARPHSDVWLRITPQHITGRRLGSPEL